MIQLKTALELKRMRRAGRLAARLLEYLTPFVQPGISTLALNDLAEAWTQKHGARSAPLNYKGFPKSLCASVNAVVCHGIPKAEEVLRSGDIVNLDLTLIVDGYHGDTSRTFLVGEVSRSAFSLVQCTKVALDKGIAAVGPGKRINVIGEAISDYLKPFGYSIVTALGGHGIGRAFHEEPFIFHHRQRAKGPRLREGMTFTIEPMINAGRAEVVLDRSDGWTVRTADGSLSAQFEHTVAVTANGVEILTLP